MSHYGCFAKTVKAATVRLLIPLGLSLCLIWRVLSSVYTMVVSWDAVCFLWVMVSDTLLHTTTSWQCFASIVAFNKTFVCLLSCNQCHYNMPPVCKIITHL